MDSSIELRNDGSYHLPSPKRHPTIRTRHREAGLVRMQPTSQLLSHTDAGEACPVQVPYAWRLDL
ncbi:hypothetical protein [Litorimonas haliclonae]|uniref:hypothetical protein n=1 Tax=Litorimonas haliclonae TaxID=2081977 RepID=UPI0039EEB2EA